VRVGIGIARCPARPWGGGHGAGSGVRRRLSGAGSRAALRRGLRDSGGDRGGGAGRRRGAGAGHVGENGLHGAGVLDGGEDTQPAVTAGAGEDIEGEHAAQQGSPGPRPRGAGGAGAGLALARRDVRGRAAVPDDVRAPASMRGEHAVIQRG